MTGHAGVLVANLGTPDAPTPAAVRAFLGEFLSDRRVVDLPPMLWRPILSGVVLRTRPARSARAYRQVWTEAGSPLLVHTHSLARALGTALAQSGIPGTPVAVGMTYGRPSIAEAATALRAAGADRIVVLPLFPQYSGTTTVAVFDRVEAALQAMHWHPEVVRIADYHADDGYVAALVESLAGRIADLASGAHLLLSFHGLPERYVRAGDPYAAQCRETARQVAARLALPASSWSLGFQSRVGFARWLGPYTEDRLRALATGGGRVIVCCPGFAVDCLETLEEIAIRGRAAFLAAGGESFDCVAALNDAPAHASALARLVASALGVGAMRAAS